MTEDIKNIAIENGGDAHGDHPGIHLIREYIDENQPKYKWDTKNNLAAFLHFGSEDETNLKWAFQKFVIEKYRFARDTDILTEETRQIIEDAQDAEFEIPIDEIQIENFQIEDEPEEYTPNDDGEASPKYKKAVWEKGILIDETFEDSGEQELASGEITLHLSQQRIHVRIEGIDGWHRRLLAKLINWFSSNCSPTKIIAVCNCPQCKQTSPETYRLDYQVLKDLKLMYSPEVQCYKSGEMISLDKVSSIERPSADVAIIYDLGDLAYAQQVKRILKEKPINIQFKDTNEILPGKNEGEAFKEILKNCQFALALASRDLVGGNELRLKWLNMAATRQKNGEIDAAIIVVRDCHWTDAAVFKGWELLNDIPISSSSNEDEAWKTVGEKLYIKIKDWLHSQAIKSNK